MAGQSRGIVGQVQVGRHRVLGGPTAEPQIVAPLGDPCRFQSRGLGGTEPVGFAPHLGKALFEPTHLRQLGAAVLRVEALVPDYGDAASGHGTRT